jgi:VanZ family protein
MILALAYGLAIVVFLMLANLGIFGPLFESLLGAYPQVDKLVHFVMYGSLAFAVNAALAGRPRWSLVRAIATGTTIVLIAAVLDECSNLVVAQRQWSLLDMAANALGVLCLGVLPWLCFAAEFGWRFGNMLRCKW